MSNKSLDETRTKYHGSIEDLMAEVAMPVRPIPASVIVVTERAVDGGERSLVSCQHTGVAQELRGRTVGHAGPAARMQ